MEGKKSVEEEAMLQGQEDIWKYMFGFVDSMALRCVVELRIADIIHSHGRPITLSQIASAIDAPSPDIACLARIMRLLVRRKIFTSTPPSDGGETLYALTHSSRWLLRDAEYTLAPMILMENDERALAPWHHLSRCVREGGIAFEKAHGRQIWDYGEIDPDFNNLFNEGMKCTARMTTDALMAGYKDGFSSVRSIVDVGGGTGGTVAEIVKAHPHVKGINFDLPHVISTAPEYPGVCHIGGDMFEAIPNADAVLMKWVMHDWSDVDCIRILRNCRRSIPEKSGKVIIVEQVLDPEGRGTMGDTGLVFDLLMIAHSSGGKERTEEEWKKLLEEGGFPTYKIIKIPALPSVIDAYPQ